jgi:hypothetical protein
MKDLKAAVKETSTILKENDIALFFVEQGKTFSLSIENSRYCLYRACSNGSSGDFQLIGKPRYFKAENGLDKALAAHF